MQDNNFLVVAAIAPSSFMFGFLAGAAGIQQIQEIPEIIEQDNLELCFMSLVMCIVSPIFGFMGALTCLLSFTPLLMGIKMGTAINRIMKI